MQGPKHRPKKESSKAQKLKSKIENNFWDLEFLKAARNF
jgi:hypothetical protein